MKSFRIKRKVTDRQLLIELPDAFDAEEIEILISSLSPKKKSTQKDVGSLLLSGPSITKQQEVQNLKTARQWLDGWNVKQFS